MREEALVATSPHNPGAVAVSTSTLLGYACRVSFCKAALDAWLVHSTSDKDFRAMAAIDYWQSILQPKSNATTRVAGVDCANEILKRARFSNSIQLIFEKGESNEKATNFERR